MKFQFSEKKVKLPEKVHAYAEKKVTKLARYFEEDAEALIVFSVEKNRNKAELTVHGAGTWFRASESTSDMFASIDAAVATIEGQRKYTLELTRLYATDDAVSDGINFYDLRDFSLVICKPDRKIIYSGCEWSTIQGDGQLNAMVAEKVTVVASKRIESGA